MRCEIEKDKGNAISETRVAYMVRENPEIETC